MKTQRSTDSDVESSQLLPELWRKVFTFDVDKRLLQTSHNLEEGEEDDCLSEQDFLSLEILLKLVACVCKPWRIISRELVQEYFKSDNRFSNWVLKQFDSLLSLRIPRFSKITDEGFSNLTNLTSLRIELSPNLTINIGLKKLTNLTHLALLSRRVGSPSDDEGISHLTKLNSLSLPNCRVISDEGFKNIGTNLTELNLAQNRSISDACLSQLTNLKNLDISHGSLISDHGLSCLTQLEVLTLVMNNSISDVGLMSLTKLKNLNLDFSEKISDKSLMKLTNLTKLSVDNSRITNKSVKKLTNLLSLSSYTLIPNDYSLSFLTNLTELKINVNEQISDLSMSLLTNLTILY